MKSKINLEMVNYIVTGVAMVIFMGVGMFAVVGNNGTENTKEVEVSGSNEMEKKEDIEEEVDKSADKMVEAEEKVEVKVEAAKGEKQPSKTTNVAGGSATKSNNISVGVKKESSAETKPAQSSQSTQSSSSNTQGSKTTNDTGLPDTITRYEWVRQGGWSKLLEAAYRKAVMVGSLPVSVLTTGEVLYYQIMGTASDICYATIRVILEKDGVTKMEVEEVALMAAPHPMCDPMRPQQISVPSKQELNSWLQALEAKYGLYQKIKGSTKK